jgi:hypothetical protein
MKIALLIIPVSLAILLSGCVQINNPFIEDSSKFKITPHEDNSAGVNPGTILINDDFSVPFFSSPSTSTIKNYDNTTWRDPRVSFTIESLPEAGKGKNDYTTLYFKATGYDEKIAGYPVIEFEENEYQIHFFEGLYAWVVDGYKRVPYGESFNLTVDLFVNQPALSHLKAGETVDITIHFANSDNSWSEDHLIRFVTIGSV